MKKSLLPKIMLSVLTGALVASCNIVWAQIPEGTANGSNAIAIGVTTKATGDSSVAIGDKADARGYDSIAIGNDAEADGNKSIAFGFNSLAEGYDSIAIGDDAEAKGMYSIALGHAEAHADDSVAIGSYSEATEDFTVSFGNDETQRRLVNVADGINPTDAINKRQLDQAVTGFNQRLGKLSGRVDKVGAGAAALAALHPLDYDPDDKLTFSAGMGNYAGENAAALGAFYRPNEKFMVSLGGTMGNGENMVNLGLSIGLDKPNGLAKLSKRELIQKVNTMEAAMSAQDEEMDKMEAKMAKMEAMLAELLAKK